MKKPDISICIPGIRTENWINIYASITNAIKKYSFEIIFVGPKQLPSFFDNIFNVRYCKDYGNPSRGLQIASYLAEGNLITWVCDDAIFLEDNLDQAIYKFLEYPADSKTIMSLIYTEGDHWKTNNDDRINRPEDWYRPKYHADLQELHGIDNSWITAIIYLMYNKDYNILGGLDCRFEGINLNLHDMCCRAQRSGYKIVFSDTDKPIHRIGWQPGGGIRNINTCPIYAAYYLTDRPLLNSIYSTKEGCNNRDINIDINNWKNVESVWSRRWKRGS